MWKYGEIVHLKDILNIDKKEVINNKTLQNFVKLIQSIPTKHIPTFSTPGRKVRKIRLK